MRLTLDDLAEDTGSGRHFELLWLSSQVVYFDNGIMEVTGSPIPINLKSSNDRMRGGVQG